MSSKVHAASLPMLPPRRTQAAQKKEVLNTEIDIEVLDPSAGKAGFCEGKGTYIVVTLVILAVIGGLVAMGLTGQFTSDGWLCKVAFPAIKKGFEDFAHWVKDTALPAIRKFLDMKANLTVGQGLLYIGLPVVGALAIIGLGRKYGPGAIGHLKAKHAEYQKEQAEDAKIKQILADHEEACNQEMKKMRLEQEKLGKQIDEKQAQQRAESTAKKRKKEGRPLEPTPSWFERFFGGDLPPSMSFTLDANK